MEFPEILGETDFDNSQIEKLIDFFHIEHFFFGLDGSWGQPHGLNIPSPWATILALRLDSSTAALTTPQKVLPIWGLVELKMLDFSDRMRTGISILTSAADLHRA